MKHTDTDQLISILCNDGGMDLMDAIRNAPLLRGDAFRIQRHNERVCSEEGYNCERGERLAAAALKRIRTRLVSTKIEVIDGSGDPRGFPVLLKLPSGRCNDFGGRGFGLPN